MKLKSYNIQLIFPCLIHQYTFTSIKKKDIINFAYQLKKNDPKGINKSNQGGWHSNPINITTDNIVSDTLKKGLWESVFSSLKEDTPIDIAYWININPPKSYNITHTHPTCDLSGVLWIKIPKNSGHFIFESPHSHISHQEINSYQENVLEQSNSYAVMKYPPVEGKMMTFSSHLPHRVAQNNSDQDRISISYNVKILPHN